MLFTLEMLPALEGDCLLLHWGTSAAPKIALIDGGPGNVYETTLLPRLKELAAARKLSTIELSLVMVSHVDNDHITGVRKLFSAMSADVDNNVPAKQRLLKASRLWHNTFNDILGDSTDAYCKTLTASIPASVGGEPNPAIRKRLKQEISARLGLAEESADFLASGIAEILAGQADGRALRNLMEVLHEKGWVKFSLNAPFQKAGKPTLLTADTAPSTVSIDDLHLAVYGPLNEDIEALQEAFDEFIKGKGLTAEAVLAAYADKSVPNLSSIVCLAGVEAQGKRRTILLTGDARGDKILQGLEGGGVLHEGQTFVDVLKVPHHGSDRNIAADFFDKVHANHYVFSADGKYGNPDRDTLGWLIKARGKNAVYDIYLTYPVAEIDVKRKAEALKKGKAWNAANDSLASLFAALAAQGYKFRLHAGDKRLIELGSEKLGI